jgi:hypothetical protein
MNPTARAAELRQRARHLRDLATRIEALPVMSLDRYADVDTWRGPRPALCRATLTVNQHQLHAAADDLRSHAWRLDRQAEELDALTRTQIGLAG